MLKWLCLVFAFDVSHFKMQPHSPFWRGVVLCDTQSYINLILSNVEMKEKTHKLAMEYLACKLSIRDRNEITRVACHSHPDHLTTMVRSLVTAYEPVIRHFHNAVDLADTVADFQAFITDMLKVAKIQSPGKDGQTVVPTVGDFILLLKKHQYSSHKFIHQLCKNGSEVVKWYLDWAKSAASKFTRDSFVDASEDQGASGEEYHAHDQVRDAGDLNEPLAELFKNLPEKTRTKIIPVLDQTGAYIDEMHASSMKRLADVIQSAPTKNTKTDLSVLLLIL